MVVTINKEAEKKPASGTTRQDSLTSYVMSSEFSALSAPCKGNREKLGL